MSESSPGALLGDEAAALLDEIADVVFVLDTTGAILHVNRRALELYGYSQEEFCRMHVRDLDAGTAHKQSEALARLITEGEVEVLDLHHRTKDGRVMRMSPHARRASMGGRDVLLSVVRQIDDAQRRDVEIERRLRDLELSRDVARAVSEGATGTELARIVVRGLRASTGLAACWVVVGGPGAPRVLAAEGIDAARVPTSAPGSAAVRAELGLGEVVEIPLRSLARADLVPSVGEFVLAAPADRLVDEDLAALGESVGALLGARLANEMLIDDLARAARENAIFHRAFIDSVEPGMIGQPPATVLELNPAFERVFGWTVDDFRSGAAAGAVSRDDLVRVHHVMAKEGRFEGEVTVHRKDGAARRVVLRGAEIVGDTGPVHVGILRDVTDERARSESERRTERLESLAALAGGVAHDFNNLLAAQMSMLAVLKRRSSPEVLEDIVALEEVTMRAASLARQLLLFARGGSRHRERLDPGELVEEVARLASRTFPPTISLDTRVDASLPQVVGDAGGLVQALLNFAVNARDAMPDGGHLAVEASAIDVAAPRLDTVPQLAPGRWVRITVADDGVGMDAATRARIFEPFFTTKAARGSGLGMSVAYGVVRDLGGALAVTSEPGHGTRVEVYLPPAER